MTVFTATVGLIHDGVELFTKTVGFTTKEKAEAYLNEVADFYKPKEINLFRLSELQIME